MLEDVHAAQVPRHVDPQGLIAAGGPEVVLESRKKTTTPEVSIELLYLNTWKCELPCMIIARFWKIYNWLSRPVEI